MSLLEMTEMLSLPIIIVAGFVLVVVLAFLMVMMRKETTYEDVIRARDRKLGDFAEGAQDKSSKAAKKKITHKTRKPELTQSDPSVSETNTSEEEIQPTSSPKLGVKNKKTKPKLETSSLPSDFVSAEEIAISPQTEPVEVSQSLPVLTSEPNPVDSSEVVSKKKHKNRPKKGREEVPISQQNGDINWSETNGHDPDQVFYLTSQLDKLTAEKNEVIHSYQDLSDEVRYKNSEIQKLKADLQRNTLSSDQQVSTLKKDNGRLKSQLQTATSNVQAHLQMQEELEKRKQAIDSVKAQNANLKGQFDTQMSQLKATIDKKEVERARILQNRDAILEDLNKANLAIAELKTNSKKLERQAKEAATDTPDAELEKSLREKTGKLATAHKSLETAERSVREKENELKRQNSELSEHKKMIDKLRDEASVSIHTQIETPVHSEDSKVPELKERVREYEQKIGELSKEIGDWEETVTSLTGEMSSLRSESSNSSEVEQLRIDLSEKETQINNLTALIESAQEELKSVGDIMSEFGEMKQQTEDLQSENELLQKSSSFQLDDSSVAELASRHAILQASISQYEDAMEDSQKENKGIKNELEKFEKNIQEKDEEIGTLKDDSKVVQETLDKFKKRNNELRENCWKMKDAVTESEKLAEKETKTIQYKIEDFLGQLLPNIRAYGEDFDEWLEKMKSSASDYLNKLEENKSNSETETDSDLQAKIQDLTVRDEVQTLENEQLKVTIRETEEEVLLLQSQVEQEFDKLKASLTVEQQSSIEKQTLIGEKESELSKSVKQCESLNQENKALKDSVVPDLEKSLKTKEGEINELTYQVDSISHKSAKLEEDLANTMRQSFEHDERTTSLQAENDSLFGLSEINQGYKKELAEAKELIRTLQAKPNSESETANGPITQAEQGGGKFKEELDSLKRENENLQQRLREMETQQETADNINNNNATETGKSKKGFKSPKLFKKSSSKTTEL